MRHVGADIHQVGDAVTALTLGIALEELAYLEEEHHEHGFGILRLGIWQESDTEGTDGSDSHQQMFIKRFAFRNSFPCLMEGLMTDQQIRNEIHQQQLEGG